MADSLLRKSGRKTGADGFVLAQSPGHLLRRAQQFVFDLYTQHVGSDELTPRQFAVLITVEQNEGLSQTDLVRLTGIDRSTLADMISRLIKRDLLTRKRTESDARANAVRISAAGRRALKSVTAAVAKAESHVLDPLPAAKRGEFLRHLALIAEAASNGDGEDAKKTVSSRGAARKSSRRAGRKAG